MRVLLQAKQHARLAEIAAQRGITTHKLVQQIVSGYLEDNKRFVEGANEVGALPKVHLEGGLGTELSALFRKCWLDAPISELRGFTLESPFESPKKAAGLRPADSRGRISPHKPSRSRRKKRA